MKITWYGHAAFKVETGETRLILDPYRSPDVGGYLPIGEGADLVVVSHENDRYHSHLGQVVPPFEVVRALELPPGGVTRLGIEIESIRVFEDARRLPEDEVTVVLIRAEGLRIVFLGDLGHPLDAEELDRVRGADILLAAAGGPPTIDYPDLIPLIEAIGPRVVIPMHYRIDGKINLAIRPVGDFFAAMPGWPVEHIGGSTVEWTRETLPAGRGIVSLRPAR